MTVGVAAIALAAVGAMADPAATPAPVAPPAAAQPSDAGPYGPGMMGRGMMGPNGMMMGQGGMMPMMGGKGDRAAMCAAMADHMDGRLAFLKTELKITAAQETLWNAYAAAARDNAHGMASRCTVMMNHAGQASSTLPDRLDQHEKFMSAQLDSIRAMNKVLLPLYAALDDTQKQAANQLMWGPMGMM
jgi:hypothetical protein